MHDEPSPEPANPAPVGQDFTSPFPQAPSGFLNDDSSAARAYGAAMVAVAAIALLANCLFTSPSVFSERHQQDTTLLKPIIDALGFHGRLPTARGVEIRNLFFYVGAACIALLAGLRMMFAARMPRLTIDDLLDIRARAASPYFWWLLLLLVSFFSSIYSHAPDMCRGQMYARFLQTAWLWPLAAMLTIRHARGLSCALLLALALTAALALWYYLVRIFPVDPARRLAYPIGNELWLGACLLPGIFLAIGLLLGGVRKLRTAAPAQPAPSTSNPALIILATVAMILLTGALYLTRARSAQLGLAAGLITLTCLLSGRLLRRILLLGTVLAALGGSLLLHRALQDDATATRTASIRSRILYEWPYALHLFFQKPIAGNGDGAYAMLAGQLARDDQIDDPGILRFDEWSWTGHAHNEILETLSDLGLIGAVAYLAAIIITLARTVHFCDRTTSASDRFLAAALGAALVAGVTDQCFNPAIREPGLPPIFLTVWAALWAMARTYVRPPRVAEQDQSLGIGMVRLGGLFVTAAALLLGFHGVQDWRGARAREDAWTDLEQHRYESSISRADFAGECLLDPFQRAQARMIGVWGRNLLFDDVLQNSPNPPTPEQMAISDEALLRDVQLAGDVPRFLRVSRLATEIYLNRARAFERFGNKEAERDAQIKMLSALVQSQKDDPFLVDRVQALWKVHARAGAMERLTWLRALLRGGEYGEEFVELFRQLPAIKDLKEALNDLYGVAQQQATRPPQQWSDRLAPETFRAAALAKALSGKPEEAARLAAQAVDMYAKAGSRLAEAHAAAIHEQVRYQFAADPLADTTARLRRLADADHALGGHADADTPLGAPLGETRLLILTAADQDPLIKAQLARLNVPAGRAAERRAIACAEVADRCLAVPTRAADALRFARRATELDPSLPQALASFLHAALQSGDDRTALEAANKLLAVAPIETTTIMLRNLRARFPASGLWLALGDKAPPIPASQPASQPAQ